MTRFTRTALLLASALVLGARAGHAQTITSPIEAIDSKWSVRAFGGWLFTDPDVNITDSTTVALGHRSGPLFGVNVALHASGPLSVEATVGVSPGERRLYAPQYDADSTFITGNDLGVDVPSTLVMVDVGLRFHVTGARTWNNLAPFVMAGGGIVADVEGTLQEETDEQLESDELYRFGPSFAVAAGLGTDWFPTRTFSLRLEAQGRLWRTKTPQGFTLPRTERSEWNPVGGITLGAAYHF